MTEELIVVEETVEEAGEAQAQRTVTEEFKVQAEDLFKVIKDVAREGTIRRVTILRNDRVLVDLPLAVGAAAGVLLAINMPVLSSLVAVGALVGGCTMRIEREEPAEQA